MTRDRTTSQQWKPVYTNGAPIPPPTNALTGGKTCDQCPDRWHGICRLHAICWKRENADVRAERGPSYTGGRP
jgi:hypothetical protein